MDRNAATLAFDAPVDRVRLVSPARAKALRGLGIVSTRDLLTHFPRRYIDLSVTRSIRDARIGENCTIRARVHRIELKRPKPKMVLVEIALVDETGTLLVTAFRQPWLMDRISAGDELAVAGRIEFDYGFKRLTNPFIEVLDAANAQLGNGQAGVVVAVHPACEKISAAWMRRLVGNALEATRGIFDPLPLSLRAKYRLMSRGQALRCIHFPQTMDDVAQARRRLVYEEVLLLELMLLQESRERFAGKQPTQHCVDGIHSAAMETMLPFSLTKDQIAARDDVMRELSAPRCANHLILGDVGTGKTILAAFAAAAAKDTGGQALFMAPTEVLAHQHGESLGPLFEASGMTWAVLTGSTPHVQRVDMVKRFSSGQLDVLMGTHALLEDDVVPQNLTLAIIDEQQRFGVEQRARLIGKGVAPDALFLTATPIPRTLALVLYGDLTLSYLRERPHHTQKRATKVLDRARRGVAFDAAKEALARGEQVYVVCPLVDERGRQSGRADRAGRGGQAAKGSASADSRTLQRFDEDPYAFANIAIEDDADYAQGSCAAALQMAEQLQHSVFVDSCVGVLHGKMTSPEKDQVMHRFREGSIQVLVATTVIEVGVDVPNATLMIIEDADRFGLSQLHQLRGRVGRGQKPGSVFLISNSLSEDAMDRLAAMERTEDGFELASYDLSLRREGDILGNRQHGASTLKLVNVVRDRAVIEAAHDDARAMLEEDPRLESPAHAALAREMRFVFRDAETKKGG